MLELLLTDPAEVLTAMLKAERAINEMQMCLMVVGIFDFLLSLSFNVKVIVIQGLGEGSFIQSINLY